MSILHYIYLILYPFYVMYILRYINSMLYQFYVTSFYVMCIIHYVHSTLCSIYIMSILIISILCYIHSMLCPFNILSHFDRNNIPTTSLILTRERRSNFYLPLERDILIFMSLSRETSSTSCIRVYKRVCILYIYD